MFFIDPDVNQQYKKDSSYGGYVYIGPNSTLSSKQNIYKQSRSNVGGCIAIIGASWAQFEGDQFEKCIAVSGGAIAAIDFKDLLVDGCFFSDDNMLN